MDNTAPNSLPPPDVALHALGHLARALEARLPGISSEWVDALQDEAALNEIVRLRGPRETSAVKRVRAQALEWAKHVRLITLARPEKPPVMPRARRAARRPDSGL